MIIASVLRSTDYRLEPSETGNHEFPTHVVSDCTNNGLSSKLDRLLTLGPTEDIPADLKPELQAQLIRIVPHYAGLIRAVPVSAGNAWTMMGGNFLHSSDSRFREACDEALALSYQGKAVKNGQLVPAKLPVPSPTFYGAVAIHDRIEA